MITVSTITGIPGIPNQDIAMWETMGPIADRTNERLGASDMAVVQFRRLMIDAARAFQAGSGAIDITHFPGASADLIHPVVVGSLEESGLGQGLDDAEHDALGQSNAAGDLGDAERGQPEAEGAGESLGGIRFLHVLHGRSPIVSAWTSNWIDRRMSVSNNIGKVSHP